MSKASYTVTKAQDSVVLALSGSWNLESVSALSKTVRDSGFDDRDGTAETSWSASTRFCIDGSKLSYIDTAGAMLAMKYFSRAYRFPYEKLELRNCSEESIAIFSLVTDALDQEVPLRKPSSLGWVSRIGRSTIETLHTLDEIACFIGRIAVASVQLLKNPKLFRIREVTNQIQATGFEAIGIVCLVTFLIGIVIAYLTGKQLEQYGANIFIVDGIALGMCRELAPILVAIVIAGRSGSAFTAQLGAMKLNQEIDAAETLGLSAIQVLVLPRVLALMLVMPMLVFVGDIAGILGGLVAADLRLGVSAPTFLERLRVVLPLKTIFVGLAKAPVFAFFIAAIACHLGLTTEPNAQSVGDNTTKTVVRAIVAVILLNATFAIIFSELGI